MRFVVVVLLVIVAGGARAQAPVRSLTLPEAQAIAEAANPMLGRTQTELSAAEGAALEVRSPLFDNPEIAASDTTRKATGAQEPGTRFREWSLGLSQKFEIAGQQRFRRDAAHYGLLATQLEIEDALVRLRAEVELAFTQVLLLQQRVVAEERSTSLAEEAANAVGKRVRAGEDSRLDGNLSSVEADRARNQLAAARERLLQARAQLATFMQLPPAELPEVAGDIPQTIGSLRLEALLERVAQRPSLRALAARESSARSRLELEKAGAFPDVTVGLATAREGPMEMREQATTLSVTVPLPLFNRNQAAIGAARTQVDQARIDREAAARNGEAAVREIWLRVQSLEARITRLSGEVLPKLDDNLQLSTKAYRAGEIGIVQLVLVNRQALDARREYLEALGEFTEARIALQLAAGSGAERQSTSNRK